MFDCESDIQPGTSFECSSVQQTPVKRRLEGVHKKDLGSQTKSVIINVLNFVKKLADPLFVQTIDFKKSQEVTAMMCGVSVRSVQRCVHEEKTSPPEKCFISPRKKYKRDKKLTKLSDFDCDVVRRSVLEFYDNGKFPTAKKLSAALKDKLGYFGSETSILRLLKNLGFRYRRSNDGRKFLLERQDIVLARSRFLRKMYALKQEESPRERIYLDETWVHQNHTQKYIWQHSDKSGGLKVPTGKGGRLIVCHAGGANGFVPQCKWVFKSKKSTTDYHSEMNSNSFKQWFSDDLLPSLEEPSVIIMDNAPYHSAQIDKVPCISWRKQCIQDWLKNKNIHFPMNDTKAELLAKVAPLKLNKRYEIDELALEWGHEVVRLPPYHCQYNPIELIWAQVKGEVAKKNNTFKIVDVLTLTSDAIDSVTVTDWKKCVQHAEKLQDEDWAKEIVRDDAIDPVIINLGEDTDTESEESEYSE